MLDVIGHLLVRLRCWFHGHDLQGRQCRRCGIRVWP